MTFRPQYHFRQTENGVLIWNVQRLVDLLRDVPTIDVPLCDIRELDEPYWFSATGENPTCRAIATHIRQVDAADLSYPVILCADGLVMDGMHRVVKALIEGRETLPAKRFARTPLHDFKDLPPDSLPY